MPEGDTLFRAATTLRKAVEGARVVSARSKKVRVEGLAGQRIDEVRAAGKNLLIRFEDGRTLRSHLRMTGSWHLYRKGEKWFRPEHQSVFDLEADNGFVIVCFNAPVLELLLPSQLQANVLQRLGPDATTDDFDLEQALARVQSLADRPVCEVLLTQAALAGVGNVIKCEALYICRVDPFLAVAQVPAQKLRQLVAACHDLLVKNRVSGPRVTRTRPGAHQWVYGRSGKPCLECGTTIRMRRVGFGARSTYYCPKCQGSV